MSEAGASSAIEIRENIWIALADGRRLAARLWLPRDAAQKPAPAVIEYMPYRKRDQTRTRDEPIHAWLAARGYACLRVDMHGSGESDGILRQEFQMQEQDDALEMIAWVAAQSWCSGAVALLGKSWGAFAALQAAMRRPPALKSVVAVCGAEDRYDQSLHFTGGVFLVEQLWWSDTMLLFNMRPPDPAIVGERWRAMWRERLEANEPWINGWLAHQRRDAFWKHGSLAENPGAVQAAIYAVGGWADYISRAVPKILERCTAPRWGLIGPWGHHYPQDGVPAPAIGFMAECDRFLRATLRGDTTAMAGEPMLRAWMPEARAPGPHNEPQNGRWIVEKAWPSPRIAPRLWHLAVGALCEHASEAATLTHRTPLAHGLASPEWLSTGTSAEAPLDQREDDGRALCFDSAPLRERVEILGAVELELDIAVDRPVAQLVARLCDVAPDGVSVRVSLVALNLTHDATHETVTACVPGARRRMKLRFPEVAHAFRAGHRLRLALATSYWPILWPSPEPVMLTVHLGASTLSLPVRPPDPEDARARNFAAPDGGPPTPITILEAPVVKRSIERDITSGTITYRVEGDGGILGPARRYRLDETGTTLGHVFRKRCMIREGDPLSAEAEYRQIGEMERDGWRIQLETSTQFRATATKFIVTCSAVAWDDGTKIFARSWTHTVPRDGG
jgi:putative CocE/NonD family hydrolase